MKKIFLLIIFTFILVIIVGCDKRRTLSDSEIKENLKTVNSIVLNEDNWDKNYIYQVNKMYIINKNNEIYYHNIDDIDQKTELESNFLKLHDIIINIFNNNIENSQIIGFDDSGSYITLFITLPNEVQLYYDEIEINEFACRVFSNGGISLEFNYENNSLKYNERIELLVAEPKLNNLIN